MALTAQDHDEAAMDALEAGNLPKALYRFQRALAVVKGDQHLKLVCLHKAAGCCVQLGQLETAEEYTNQAIELEKELHNRPSFESLFRRGNVRRLLGNIAKARVDLMLAADQVPDPKDKSLSPALRKEAERMKKAVEQELEALRPIPVPKRPEWSNDVRLEESITNPNIPRLYNTGRLSESRPHLEERAAQVRSLLGVDRTVSVAISPTRIQKRCMDEKELPFPASETVLSYVHDNRQRSSLRHP